MRYTQKRNSKTCECVLGKNLAKNLDQWWRTFAFGTSKVIGQQKNLREHHQNPYLHLDCENFAFLKIMELQLDDKKCQRSKMIASVKNLYPDCFNNRIFPVHCCSSNQWNSSTSGVQEQNVRIVMRLEEKKKVFGFLLMTSSWSKFIGRINIIKLSHNIISLSYIYNNKVRRMHFTRLSLSRSVCKKSYVHSNMNILAPNKPK